MKQVKASIAKLRNYLKEQDRKYYEIQQKIEQNKDRMILLELQTSGIRF